MFDVMGDATAQVLTQAGVTAPLFLLVLLGYGLTRYGQWPTAAADALTRFVFAVAIPAYLFTLMSGFSKLPSVDARLLIAYFGGGLAVFVAARIFSSRAFRMDGAQQSVFGVGTIFSNSVLLGIPLAQATLGEEVLPAVSLVIVFNSFVLWTLVTVSVEWARNRDVSLGGFARTAREVVTNPVVAAILLGTVFGYTGLQMPVVVGRTLDLVSQAALPMSLIVLGMGLAEYGVREGWRISLTLTALKLAAMPIAVWADRRSACAAAHRNPCRGDAGGVAGRRQRLPDGSSVPCAGGAGGVEPRAFDRPRRADDAAGPHAGALRRRRDAAARAHNVRREAGTVVKHLHRVRNSRFSNTPNGTCLPSPASPMPSAIPPFTVAASLPPTTSSAAS